MTITTLYDMGQQVEHVTGEDGRVGVIIAFMLRGYNHSYQVQWVPTIEPSWHLDFELVPSVKRPPIGIPHRTQIS